MIQPLWKEAPTNKKEGKVFCPIQTKNFVFFWFVRAKNDLCFSFEKKRQRSPFPCFRFDKQKKTRSWNRQKALSPPKTFSFTQCHVLLNFTVKQQGKDGKNKGKAFFCFFCSGVVWGRNTFWVPFEAYRASKHGPKKSVICFRQNAGAEGKTR